MFSPETLRALSAEAAARAAAEDLRPYAYWPQDEVAAPFPFPNLGDHRPEGWTLIDTLFADKTGWGADDEPALTPDQLVARVAALNDEHRFRVGYGIIEEGQFQVVIGVFLREGVEGAAA